MTHVCERCRRPGPLYHCRAVDEYLCEGCIEQVCEDEADEVEA